ncbi:ABC transporter substrate-binding protein [Azospirillum thermophilum]|uniref:ABC transporter substrate-binding protein n=1 Tax=Azospirillum thermophilum TaxID=2202148 RepID=A0A2S2CL56_9PROT|nr:ABC transporter substrate-binding protein [Azospirillum thermophilum]AWK85202.1 ABC transporter substrate-binding protein [Azospirillum thermophilum]
MVFAAARALFLLLLLCISAEAGAEDARPATSTPVTVALDGEFGLTNSTSAESIQRGILTAIDEINRAGGVLNGRPLQLITREHRSISARGIKNIRELAAMPDLVAVFGGRFSPVVIEELPTLLETKTLFLAPWSSADAIVDNGMEPNFIFRLSLRDSLAMPFMLRHAEAIGAKRVGLLLTNTAWGRSNLAAAERHLGTAGRPALVETVWYNWRDTSLIDKYRRLLEAGAEAVVLVANDDEAAILVREMAALPGAQRLPIISHWGVTGGNFVGQAGPALQEVDFRVIQTVSLFRCDPAKVRRVLAVTERLFGIGRIEEVVSPVGFAHAYDLTHILARAIDLAGTTDRAAVRDALEKVEDYDGLVKYYKHPFTPTQHEALAPDNLLMARFTPEGVLVPID